MKKIFAFIKRPIPMWLLVPFLFLLAAPLVAAPPIWYGGLNLDQGSKIQDPSVSVASCVITNAQGVYGYQTCPPTPYPTPTNPATAAPIVIPSPTTFPATTTGTTNTQLASLTTTSGTSNGPIGAWVLEVIATTGFLNNAVAGDIQFLCVYANSGPTNAAGPLAGNCGTVTSYTLYASVQSFTAASTLAETPSTIVWQGQYANSTTVTIRLYSTNSISASGSLGAGGLTLKWIPI